MEPGPIKEVDKEMPVGARSNILDPGRVRELVNSSVSRQIWPSSGVLHGGVPPYISN